MLHQRKYRMLQRVFVLLAKLLIHCILIVETTGITHATTNAVTTTTAAVTSMLATTSQHSNMPQNWLRRQRRYLLFGKGTIMILDTLCAKAVISEYPRGIFMTYEYSTSYPLPSSVDDIWPKPRKAHPTTKAKTKTKQVAMTKQNTTIHAATVHTPKLLTFGGSQSNYSHNNAEKIWLSPWHATATDWPAAEETIPTWWQMPARRRQWLSGHTQQLQKYGKQYNVRQQHGFPAPLQPANAVTFTPPQLSRKLSKLPVIAHPPQQQLAMCPRRNVYGSWQQNVPRLCATAAKTFGRGRKQRSDGVGENVENNDDTGHRIDERAKGFHFATNAERVFFDLLAQWAHIYNYPPHYCIMRTFCESRHLLAARGQSLFHDLLRILIDAALPAARRHATYKKAISHDNLSDCAQHYATLCGLSFLQHINELVHGRFMQ